MGEWKRTILSQLSEVKVKKEKRKEKKTAIVPSEDILWLSMKNL